MARKSSITKLDPRIRTAVDKAIRDGNATIDQIIETIESMGGEASRSAVGRYKQNAERQMERYRQAQEISKVWVGKLGEDPDSDVGRLISEMLRTVAFQTISDFDGSADGTATPQDLFFIGKAIKELAQADKISADRALAIRKETLREAADVIESEAQAAGMGKDQAKFWRQKVLGIV